MKRSKMMMLVLACACLPAVGLLAQKKFGWDWRHAEINADYPGGAYASDPVRRKIYRFGGRRGPSLSNETWEFDGKRWRELHPKHSPPPLALSMMSFDPVTKKIILFGGITQVDDRYGASLPFAHSARTWAWDGQDWNELFPKLSPSARFGGSRWIVSEAKNRRVVLHGGAYYPGGISSIPLNDTWVWNGLTWREIQSPQKPSLRSEFDLAYHAGNGSTVLFGGVQYPRGPYLNDTWVLRGNKWSLMPKSKVSPPSARSGYLAHSDFITKELWLFGGGMFSNKLGKQVYYDDLWSWNGKKWRKLGSGYGKSWNMPWLQHMGSIGPLLYLDVSYYPGNTETTRRGTRTFRWQGPGWKEVTRWASDADLIRGVDPVVYDPDRNEILQFRRETIKTGNAYGSRVEVYRLEGGHFQPVLVTGVKPVQTNRFMDLDTLLYDEIQKKFVFFTGRVAQKDYGQWGFKDGKWSFLPIRNADPQLWKWLLWDPIRKKPLAVAAHKLYAFDGQSWTVVLEDKKGPATGQLAYDVKRSRYLMYVASPGPTYSARPEVWELSGKAWKKVSTKTSPDLSWTEQKFLYVPEFGGCLLLGGEDGKTRKALAGTWLFDGRDWSRLSVGDLPQMRVGQSVTHVVRDAGRRRVLAFYSNQHPMMRELAQRTLGRSQPLVKRGESTVFEVAMPQQGGRPFLLGLSLSRKKGIPVDRDPIFGTRLFPLDFDSMLAWSMGGPILTVLDQAGRGKIPFRIPKDPTIPEMDLWASGFTLDLVKLKLGEVSNTIPLQIIR